MKLYYKTLSKDKREDIKGKFLNSKESLIYKKANRIIIVCIIGIIFSIMTLTFDLLYKIGIINYILDLMLFVFCLIFLVVFNNIKMKEINKFALKKANK